MGISSKLWPMKEITFEDLPRAVSQLFNKLEAIESLLLINSRDTQLEQDQWLDLTELCNYLPDKPAKSTVYSWVHSGMIPYHKGAKKLRFLKSEIDQWLKNGKRKTKVELANEVGQYIKRRAGE